MKKMRILVLIMISVLFVSNIIAGEIRIVTTTEAPTNYISEGKVTGTSTDIVNEIKKYLNEDAKIEVFPWARSYDIAKRESNVLVYTCGKTQERIDLGFTFLGPVITRDHILYKKKGNNITINKIEDIRKQNFTVGALRGSWRGKYFKNENITVEETNTHRSNAKKLFADRIDLWVLSDIEAPSVMKEAGFNMSDLEIAFVFKTSPSYMMFSKNTSPKIIAKWESAFEKIKTTDFYDNATKKWSDILGMDIAYSSEKGFYIKK